MIRSIRHKGIRLYYEEGNGAKLPNQQLAKIARFLTALDAIDSEVDILALGSGIHQLKGNYKGFWSLTITGNYRLIFRFDPPDVYDVDYVDYH